MDVVPNHREEANGDGCIFDLMESTILERGPYRYVEEGEGTPLVLLHGLFGALSNFQEVRAHSASTSE